jgi:hypothetical protein
VKFSLQIIILTFEKNLYFLSFMIKFFRTVASLLFVGSVFWASSCQKFDMQDVAPKAKGNTQNRLAPDVPVIDCNVNPELCYGSGGASGNPHNTITFSNTETIGSFVSQENPTGAIVMVAIVFNRSDVPGGWYLLDKNLNEGCTGYFSSEQIYLIFTRDPQAARNYANSTNDPIPHPITAIGAYERYREPSGWQSGIWKKSNSIPDGHLADLNDGVGGQNIQGVLKYNTSSTTTPQPEIEIGVLRAFNNSNAQPPTGWTRFNKDLNEGAGGEYVYFCYKNR